MATQLHPPGCTLEAATDTEVPPRSWRQLLDAGQLMLQAALPGRVAALRVMDGAAIRRLNREFRGVDAATDVLSFPAGDAGLFAGDIALSWDAARRQARQHGHSVEAEAVALLAHALLHLAGWDHPDAAAQARMDVRTLELCRLAGFEVNAFGH
jgi:rRNA maturation RNase YbeY